MKNFLSMAALALVGAVMTGCSSDDNIQQPANNDNAYILKTTISFDTDDVTNRALSVDFINKKATKTFAVGDRIAVFFVDGKGRSMRALSDALTIDDIHNDGKSADFTVNFLAWSGASPGDDTQVRYVYPANMAKGSIEDNAEINDANTIDYSNLAYQTGDLDYLGEAYDLAVFDGNFSDGNLPASATLLNRLAILALTLKNSDGSSTITSGLVSVEVEGSETYPVAPKGGGTFGEDVIYVAIKPETVAKALKITASDGTNEYEKTLTSRTYAAGNFYNMPVRMAPASVATDLSSITGAYIASDGETLTGTLGANVQISIAAGATVTLDGVSINADGTWTSGDYAGLTCVGDATIILKDGTTNTVRGFYEDYPGIYVPVGYTVTIKGSGSLTASSNDYGAGIGGGFGISCGNIEIQGGVITATGGDYAAGIGAASGVGIGESICGTITISGGTVTAIGGSYAAGIGSGYAQTKPSTCGAISISGGIVSATAGLLAPAAIGKGAVDGGESTCASVTITPGITSLTLTNTNSGVTGIVSDFINAGAFNADTNPITYMLPTSVTDPTITGGMDYFGFTTSYNEGAKTWTITKK